MYITLDVEECPFDPTLANIIIFKHRKNHVSAIPITEAIPMYQAIAMLNALKAANPEDYRNNKNVLRLVPSSVSKIPTEATEPLRETIGHD